MKIQAERYCQQCGARWPDKVFAAVNAHKELLTALKEIVAVFEKSGADEPFKDQYNLAKQAIARAEALR